MLITNRHNVTGRRQDDDQPLYDHGGVPDRMVVWFPCRYKFGTWTNTTIRLLDDDEQPLWHEHPTLGKAADIVAIACPFPQDAHVVAYSLSPPEREMLLRPSETLSIVGFPFGMKGAAQSAIWVSGYVASEIELDFEDLPRFLVDCRGRPGMSGSPVLAFRPSGMINFKTGEYKAAMMNGPVLEFFGVYSGRIHPESDIGIVWKRSSVIQLVESLPAN
ncbi:hypothetical protein J2Z75_001620 [Rhizobium herbae]|uniref:Serine protease n=1 Tax=Rhizobium herbae TaxID=508661 RepID=A0ABS4EJK1_9HYPH|nr:hypothetical protein [Rhizobium herbae]